METGSLPPRWGEYARRLPYSLADLKGPAAGEVELPLHVAWSGRRVYDVGDSGQRLALYALLLAEAQREDLERFVHPELLVSMWPRLRAAGYGVRLVEATGRYARLVLRLPGSARELEVDLLKEALGPGYVTVRVALRQASALCRSMTPWA